MGTVLKSRISSWCYCRFITVTARVCSQRTDYFFEKAEAFLGKRGTQRQVGLLALEFAELESNKDKEMAILAKDKEMAILAKDKEMAILAKEMELSLAVNKLNTEMMVKSIRSKARMDLQVISQR